MKKGISPLISTILLVGLSVALIASITIWTNNLKESTTKFAATQQKILDVTRSGFNFEVTNIVKGTGGAEGKLKIDITVTNLGEYPITKFSVIELNNNNERIGTQSIPVTIGPYAAKTFQITTAQEATKVELVSYVKVNDEEILVINTAVKLKIPR